MKDNEANMEMETLKAKWLPIILWASVWMSYVRYSIYRSIFPYYVKKKEIKGWADTCMWLDTHQETFMIKALKEACLCQCLCAHEGGEIARCYRRFHVLLSLFCMSGFRFLFAARLSYPPHLIPLLSCTLLPFSAPTGQPGCIHQASRFVCLFMAAAPVDPEPQ